ncbi:methyltransferase [Plantactinospora endophytica]|uniref:SAM-dependent methyltransferase n=1 Tax=Plantactinospora endophytica TaxID=673535 RepID=A0ABQ4E070_9ACTN|nr:methyltransferase [Plantactinospora endophytica]GIG88118.1 SAM-dependent methyltransferase [Plantactinospora endophytica]
MTEQPVPRVFAVPGQPSADAGTAPGDAPLPTPAGPPTPARITEAAAGFMLSKLLFVATEVDLFAAIPPEGATPQTIAERCRLPERSAATLPYLLAAAGLLERDGDRYRNAPDTEAFLSGRGPLDLRPILRYWDTVSYASWSRAGTAFRTRQPVRGELTREQTEAYESAVAAVTTETAVDLARAYDFGRHRRLLDVGGGIGTFARPILRGHPQLTGTLLELPEVASIVGPDVSSGEFAERLDVRGADVFTDRLPDGHDAIVVANFLHLFPPERNLTLLTRLREVAPPDGRLLLVDWWRDGPTPHPSARFAAGEFLMISGGDTYRPDEVADWLTATGWRFVGHQPLSPPAGLIVAEPADRASPEG